VDPEIRFRAVFDAAYGPLARYFAHRGLTGPDAEDLVAQSLEVAWRRIDDVPEADPLTTRSCPSAPPVPHRSAR
jgi:DNA-directed RNA polymerase specialized sigma24 family protein